MTLSPPQTQPAQTLAEQILSHACGRPTFAGEVVTCAVDLAMVHDSIAPAVIRILTGDLGAAGVWDRERVAVAIDHVAPAATIQTATAQDGVRRWAIEQDLPHFFETGRGICHQVILEERLARPGMLVVGSDSHSTAYGAAGAFGTGMGATDIALALATGQTWLRVPETVLVRARGELRPGVSAKDVALHIARELRADGATYEAVEYHGFDAFTLGERTTLTSMAVEVGAKAGIVAPTGPALASYDVPEWFGVQPGASYRRVLEVDLGALEPQIAAPSFVDNVTDLGAVAGGDPIAVNVVYLGTCTNGRHEDMAAAARILRGRRVARGVRLIVVPASSQALQQAAEDGTLSVLLEAGAAIGTPGCGACIGRHMGVLAPGDVCLFTGNRNFRGRMGSPEAQIYLGSPEVAAATAVTGFLTDPRALGASPA
ncbi:3-isopropylmalate dehydratase large subunit [Deinococcus sp. SDU3-2]|uniref:3-isopropylmalate dehydratase large subunit n=1 Tax=Deinococcus terrestris TaxID=2651870 RepID=A0A7X1TR63_9DEIO|nr:3-isopropylmalate dehydratase large subunit [Deinococcus terrestris]MPY66430.1 3-isopropylmalate dehydratase large subunit [Deinococcus terrestris]